MPEAAGVHAPARNHPLPPDTAEIPAPSDRLPGTAARTPTATDTGAVKKKRPAFYGWWIVVASSLTNGLGGSLHWQGFQVLFLPVSQGLNLSHAQTAAAFSLARAENGVIGPVTGWMIDRFGVKPLMIGGTLMAGAGDVLLSRTNTYLAFLLVYILIVSVGGSTTFMQATTAAINHWFVRKRGLAMSINSAAFRGGSALMVPVLSWFVLRYGWQTGALWVGLFLIVVITPIALFFKKSPEALGQLPDGGPVNTKAGASSAGRSDADDGEWGVKEAIKTRAFWVLALATVLRMSAHGAVFVHLIALLVSKGQGQQASANMVGALALVSVPLILVTGWLSDRMSRQKMLFFCYMSAGASLLLLTVVDGMVPIMLALVLFTGSESGASLNWAIVGDLFGRKKYATIRGMLAPIYNAALVVTPVAAGLVYDRTGSYNHALVAGAALFALSAVTFLLLRPPKRSTPMKVPAAASRGTV